MLPGGYVQLGRIRGVPIRAHWSTPIGAVVFTGFSLSPGLWLGFFLIILLHELGHALVVQRLGYRVRAVRIHAFGGDCAWEGDATEIEIGVVAWGGVLAQAAVGLVALGLVLALGWPANPILAALAGTFLYTNVRMILFNLIPLAPLDGHRAWPLLPMLWQARREQRAYAKRRAEQQVARTREAERAQARQVVNQEIARASVPDEDLAPMPPEVEEVLARIMKRGPTSTGGRAPASVATKSKPSDDKRRR